MKNKKSSAAAPGRFVRSNKKSGKIKKKENHGKNVRTRNKYPSGDSSESNGTATLSKKKLRKLAAEEAAKANEIPVKKLSKKQKLQQREGKDFHNQLVDDLKGSRFRFINELLYSRKGKDAAEIFKEDSESFQTYHDGYRKQVEYWPLNPLDRLIKSISTLPKHFIVGDFGCGEGRLAKSIPNKTYSLDLVAARSDIIACDMANTPLETNSLNVAVYCLSLMGTNLKDFLLEANRVLKIGGHLKIAEVESRFEDIRKFIDNVTRCGFKLMSQDISTKIFYFLYFKKTQDVKKDAKDVPDFALKPCLYKRR